MPWLFRNTIVEIDGAQAPDQKTWSTESQNQLAEAIKTETQQKLRQISQELPVRTIKKGDTLAAVALGLIKGLEAKGVPIREKWKNKSIYSDYIQFKTSGTDKTYKLTDEFADKITPGQKIWLEKKGDGYVIVLSDTMPANLQSIVGPGTQSQGGPPPTAAPSDAVSPASSGQTPDPDPTPGASASSGSLDIDPALAAMATLGTGIAPTAVRLDRLRRSTELSEKATKRAIKEYPESKDPENPKRSSITDRKKENIGQFHQETQDVDTTKFDDYTKEIARKSGVDPSKTADIIRDLQAIDPELARTDHHKFKAHMEGLARTYTTDLVKVIETGSGLTPALAFFNSPIARKAIGGAMIVGGVGIWSQWVSEVKGDKGVLASTKKVVMENGKYFIPFWGNTYDYQDSAKAFKEGKYWESALWASTGTLGLALDTLSLVPVVGTTVGQGGKLAVKAGARAAVAAGRIMAKDGIKATLKNGAKKVGNLFSVNTLKKGWGWVSGKAKGAKDLITAPVRAASSHVDEALPSIATKVDDYIPTKTARAVTKAAVYAGKETVGSFLNIVTFGLSNRLIRKIGKKFGRKAAATDSIKVTRVGTGEAEPPTLDTTPRSDSEPVTTPDTTTIPKPDYDSIPKEEPLDLTVNTPETRRKLIERMKLVEGEEILYIPIGKTDTRRAIIKGLGEKNDNKVTIGFIDGRPPKILTLDKPETIDRIEKTKKLPEKMDGPESLHKLDKGDEILDGETRMEVLDITPEGIKVRKLNVVKPDDSGKTDNPEKFIKKEEFADMITKGARVTDGKFDRTKISSDAKRIESPHEAFEKNKKLDEALKDIPKDVYEKVGDLDFSRFALEKAFLYAKGDFEIGGVFVQNKDRKIVDFLPASGYTTGQKNGGQEAFYKLHPELRARYEKQYSPDEFNFLSAHSHPQDTEYGMSIIDGQSRFLRSSTTDAGDHTINLKRGEFIEGMGTEIVILPKTRKIMQARATDFEKGKWKVMVSEIEESKEGEKKKDMPPRMDISFRKDIKINELKPGTILRTPDAQYIRILENKNGKLQIETLKNKGEEFSKPEVISETELKNLIEKKEGVSVTKDRFDELEIPKDISRRMSPEEAFLKNIELNKRVKDTPDATLKVNDQNFTRKAVEKALLYTDGTKEVGMMFMKNKQTGIIEDIIPLSGYTQGHDNGLQYPVYKMHDELYLKIKDQYPAEQYDFVPAHTHPHSRPFGPSVVGPDGFIREGRFDETHTVRLKPGERMESSMVIIPGSRKFIQCREIGYRNNEWKIQVSEISKPETAPKPPEPKKTPESPKKRVNYERKHWRDVPRSTEVKVVGDLHGNYDGFKANLEHLGAAKFEGGKIKWTGGNRRVVFHGDILADRGTDGLRIMSEIADLRKQAQKEGGDITVLMGNHDNFMVEFFMDKQINASKLSDQAQIDIGHYEGAMDRTSYNPNPNKDHNSGFVSAFIGGGFGNSPQGLGLLELRRFGSDNIKNLDIADFSQRKKCWLELQNERETILKNMRTDPEGQKILESICSMKVAERIDDTLFFHTNPTQSMIDTLIQLNHKDPEYDPVDTLNYHFQQGLRDILINGKDPGKHYNSIERVFLDTGNRTNFSDADMANKLQEMGINQIFYGHTNDALTHEGGVGKHRIIEGSELELHSVDYSAFKKGEKTDKRSAATIKTDGSIETGVKNKKTREP